MTICLRIMIKPMASSGRTAVPPGSFGWPLVGETMQLLLCGSRGRPHDFILSRRTKHSQHVFKTSLFGEKTAIVCGPAGNKLIFTSENKLVSMWLPASMKKLFPRAFTVIPNYEEAMQTRKLITGFMRQEMAEGGGLVGRLDSACKAWLRRDWVGKEKVVALGLIRKHAFSSIWEMMVGGDGDDEELQARLREEFAVMSKGMIQLPLCLPGTKHRKAIRSARVVKEELLQVIRRKRKERAAARGRGDMISHLMMGAGKDYHHHHDEVMIDDMIADNMMFLMMAGHESTCSTMVLILKYLAENPHCYQRVYQEQKEIRLSKKEGELLRKEDMKRMSYSWNVVNEVLRLEPPAQASFREAIADFTHEGFTVPKGWKVWWTVLATHKNPEYFKEPEKFDPSRFEGSGPAPYIFIPFGGGPRICPGRDFAYLEILVFLHNVVQEFKWELVNPGEKITIDPIPAPSEGLPILLHPHPHHI
ncbi:hypothetical protein ACLOJK_008611 [Asimina triloba]